MIPGTSKSKEGESDIEDISPFAGLTKSTVLQECSASFNDPDVVTKHPRRCCRMITSLLYLMSQGETFSSSEASEVFFGVTKLFQSDDLNLRRMVYLFIKEVDFNRLSFEFLASSSF